MQVTILLLSVVYMLYYIKRVIRSHIIYVWPLSSFSDNSTIFIEFPWFSRTVFPQWVCLYRTLNIFVTIIPVWRMMLMISFKHNFMDDIDWASIFHNFDIGPVVGHIWTFTVANMQYIYVTQNPTRPMYSLINKM